jgi:uncharacterized membrane protein YfcA
MTTEEKQFWTAIATVAFNVIMLASGLTFAQQYQEILLFAGGVVSIIAASFLGITLQKPMRVARAARIESQNKP